MTSYEFTLTVSTNPIGYAEQLFEVAEGELVPEGGNGTNMVHAVHDTPTLADAVAWAVAAVEQVGLMVTGVEAEDTVSLKDIAARTGRTYESVRRLATGQRGPGGFPAPFSTDSWALYSWAEVAVWLAEHYGGQAVPAYDREIAATDYLLRARHMLADDPHRAEFAQLVA